MALILSNADASEDFPRSLVNFAKAYEGFDADLQAIFSFAQINLSLGAIDRAG